MDTGCNLEHLPWVIDHQDGLQDREREREREREKERGGEELYADDKFSDKIFAM